MKIFKIAQSVIYYHGSKTLEKQATPRDFPGVYFTPNPQHAQTWGKYVAAYNINSNKFYKPNTTNIRINSGDFNILSTFIEQYGYKPKNVSQQWQNMGAQTKTINSVDEYNFWDIMSQVLLFPTTEWVDYLGQLGYDGFINNDDLFMFNLNKVQYVGQYDFKQNELV